MSYVIAKLMGGLGNQLFQYAAGRAVAGRLDVPLLLDLSFLDDRSGAVHTIRDYALDVYRVNARLATPDEIRAFDAHRPRGRFRTRLEPIVSTFRRTTYCRERGRRYDPALERVRPPVYLDGFWQDERYFVSIAGRLRDELSPREPLDAKTTTLLNRIGSTSSISIHVRRGDYVTDPTTNAYHGVLGADYYQAAIRRIQEGFAEPHFFVFSDDPDWAEANIVTGHPTVYVRGNDGKRAFIDLFLMQHCLRHVIANSSFSWWGAWMSARADKTVIGPARWFAGLVTQNDDVLPKSWIRL